MNISKCGEEFRNERVKQLFAEIYGDDATALARQESRYIDALSSFHKIFPDREEVEIYSASGRTEIGGNHTDHQRGVVLAGAVNLDIIAVASFHNDGVIRVKSEGFDLAEISLGELSPNVGESGTLGIVRGVAAQFVSAGVDIGGFDVYTTSDVIRGGGISSSAAFETLMATIINIHYNEGKCSPFEIAKIGWYAENFFFGKKCGLLDQTTSSYGGLITADFADVSSPAIDKIYFDFEKYGYALCVTDTKSDHADLTDDYDAITDEMRSVAEYFGCEVLSQVNEGEFYSNIAKVRTKCSDRAILRAIHFFDETKRAGQEADALRSGDIDRFLALVNASGESSANLLQNLYSAKSPKNQAISLGIAISKKVLGGKGAVRVHGGGFAGTIQAYVPLDKADEYKKAIEDIYGAGTCHKIRIRPYGGIRII